MHRPTRWTLALGLAAAALAACAQDDVPFVTTPDQVTLAMLELARVGPGDHLIDLGSGDGRIVITAARRFGATGLGVELVPDLVQRSRERARAAGVDRQAAFRTQDLFDTDLSAATVVTMYLLPDVNLQLRPRLLALAPGTRIVSHDYAMGDWQAERSVTVDVPKKEVGSTNVSQVHLWIVPAQVHGLWCAEGTSLRVEQRFQQYSAALLTPGRGGRALVFDGRIAGASLRPLEAHPPVLQLEGERLRVAATNASTELEGRAFLRAADGRCAANTPG